jgi:hypothetical protein
MSGVWIKTYTRTSQEAAKKSNSTGDFSAAVRRHFKLYTRAPWPWCAASAARLPEANPTEKSRAAGI